MDVETVAARSYWHPNGYAKLVLADSPQGQTRLHIWTETGDGGDIHDHAWDYQSTVLAGKFDDFRYKETLWDRDVASWRHSYKRIGDRRWAQAEPVPTWLRCTGGGSLASGDQATGKPGTIHRFSAVQIPAVTLIRVGPVVGHSHIYLPQPDIHTISPRTISPADITELIDLATRLAPRLDLHTLVTG